MLLSDRIEKVKSYTARDLLADFIRVDGKKAPRSTRVILVDASYRRLLVRALRRLKV